jgi:hypothetical protein
MAVGDGEVSIRVHAPSVPTGLTLLIGAATGSGPEVTTQAIREGFALPAGRLYGSDHDETEDRIVELVEQAPSFGAVAQVIVDDEEIGLDEFRSVCEQWREIVIQVRRDTNRE